MRKFYNFYLTDDIDSVIQDHPMNLNLLQALPLVTGLDDHICTAPHLHLATDKVIT